MTAQPAANIVLPDINIIKDNLELILSQAGLEWDSRVFPDKIVAGLDYILSITKNSSSNSFNRAIFSHILEFSKINSSRPILVSDFFNSYFLVYDSMIENKSAFAVKCNLISNNIQLYNNELFTLSQSESLESNGRTSTSCLRIELDRIQVFKDLTDTALDYVFNNSYICIEPFTLENKNNKFNNRFKESSIITIPLTTDSIENKHVFEFPLKNVESVYNVVFYDFNKKSKVLLETIKIKDYYDMLVNKSYEIIEKGYVDFDIIYVNSKVDYYNRKIIEFENEYKEAHVVYDNLTSSLLCLEEPFTDYIISHRKKSKLDSREKNPADNELGRNKTGAKIAFQRKEIEVSEKIEKTLLSLSGRKCIFWETIYFIFNKLMLICSVLVLLYRPDFATFILACLGIGFEAGFLNLDRFGKTILALFLSLIFDFFWVIINLLDWGDISPLEGPSLAKWRRFTVVISFINILLKIIICFSGWRMNIIYKIKRSNPYKQHISLKLARRGRKVSNNNKRPVITHEHSKAHNIRFVENLNNL